MVFLLMVGFAGVAFRLVDLQVLQHKRLTAEARKKIRVQYPIEPRRGDILDSKGMILATTTFSDIVSVCCDPSTAGTNYQAIARTLAPILEESESKLAQKLMPKPAIDDEGRVLTNTPSQYQMLKRRVPTATWEKALAAMTNMVLEPPGKKLSRKEAAYYDRVRRKSIFCRSEPSRVYPNKELAAHVIGYTSPDELKIQKSTVVELVGIDGIEESFNDQLAGIRGWRVTGFGKSEGKRREQVWMREQNIEPRHGYNVVLTIDSVIQRTVEAALTDTMRQNSPDSVACVVIQPKTGAILAMATLPNYDPSNPRHATRNRVISDRIEPGSTFKIVVVSASLNEHTASLTDRIFCENGSFYYRKGQKPLRDHVRHGFLTVEEIITKSSNIGAAKLALGLGGERLYEYMLRFGFDVKTGIPLIGEVTGWIPPVKKWSGVTIYQIPMGQGLTATPLQMAMAMCAIANKGVLMRPMLVDRLEDREGAIVTKYSPQRVRQVMSEDAARQMVQALKTVVSKNGTAHKAEMDHYVVAGKTGTANKAEGGFYTQKYYSSFIGFFPADDPELCISITLDEPRQGHYGGETATPAFKHIAERAGRYLGIKPDRDPDEPPANPLASAGDTRGAKPAVEVH